jgi:hypothetical protein
MLASVMPPYFGYVRHSHDPVDESLSCEPGFIFLYKIEAGLIDNIS